MAIIPFVGPTYDLDSKAASSQRTVNLVPVPLEPGNERTKWVFKDVPGLTEFSAPIVPGQWNPDDKSPRITLTNANKSAGNDGLGSGDASVRGLAGRSSGKLYFEVATSSGYGGGVVTDNYVGVADSSMSLTAQPLFGAGGGHYSAFRLVGQYGNQSGYEGVGSVTFVGLSGINTVGVCVTFATRTVDFYVNGVISASTTYSAGGGDMYPLGSQTSGSAGECTLDIKTQAGDFLESIPAGATAWGS